MPLKGLTCAQDPLPLMCTSAPHCTHNHPAICARLWTRLSIARVSVFKRVLRPPREGARVARSLISFSGKLQSTAPASPKLICKRGGERGELPSHDAIRMRKEVVSSLSRQCRARARLDSGKITSVCELEIKFIKLIVNLRLCATNLSARSLIKLKA